MKLSLFLYRIEYVLNKLKTILWYRLLFRHIGAGSVIFSPMMLLNSESVRIGKKVLVRKGLRMEVVTRPDGRGAYIEIGDNTNIEQNVHIICQNRIVIGQNVSITGGCVIIDTTHPYDIVQGKVGDQIRYNDDEIVIGNNVFVGMGSVILPGTIIGAHSYIGAKSIVKGKFPERSLIYGSPARVVKTI